MARTKAMPVICATSKHRTWSERAEARAELHLVAAELDHELGVDRIAYHTRIQPLRAAEIVVGIQPKSAKWRSGKSVVEDQIC